MGRVVTPEDNPQEVQRRLPTESPDAEGLSSLGTAAIGAGVQANALRNFQRSSSPSYLMSLEQNPNFPIFQRKIQEGLAKTKGDVLPIYRGMSLDELSELNRLRQKGLVPDWPKSFSLKQDVAENFARDVSTPHTPNIVLRTDIPTELIHSRGSFDLRKTFGNEQEVLVNLAHALAGSVVPPKIVRTFNFGERLGKIGPSDEALAILNQLLMPKR